MFVKCMWHGKFSTTTAGYRNHQWIRDKMLCNFIICNCVADMGYLSLSYIAAGTWSHARNIIQGIENIFLALQSSSINFRWIHPACKANKFYFLFIYVVSGMLSNYRVGTNCPKFNIGQPNTNPVGWTKCKNLVMTPHLTYLIMCDSKIWEIELNDIRLSVLRLS